MTTLYAFKADYIDYVQKLLPDIDFLYHDSATIAAWLKPYEVRDLFVNGVNTWVL